MNTPPLSWTAFAPHWAAFNPLQSAAAPPTSASPASASPGATPAMGTPPWLLPSPGPEELDKRIQKLQSVLFWLEQNATALKASIHALEVQKLTLATLQQMNVQMGDLARHWTATAQGNPPAQTSDAAAPTGAAGAAGGPDLTQWWAGLAQQFQQLATQAMPAPSAAPEPPAAAQPTPPNKARTASPKRTKR